MSKTRKYDLIALTSMGLRLLPENRQAVEVSRNFLLQSTSAESNVLQISASLGLRTKVLTAFVENNIMSQFLKNDLRMRGIEYDAPEIEAGGPWGYRHQINIADSGFGLRAPTVQNDRAGEVGQILHQDHFDLDKLFFEDGVRMIHFSGLIVALSDSTAELCLTLAEKARQAGTLISFDLNHRASFWKDREAFLYERFHKIAQMADILIGNEEDFQLALKIPGPKTNGIGDVDQVKAQYSELIENAKQRYPQATTFATTIRHVISANVHGWGAFLFSGDELFEEPMRHIDIFDRIGGGDGFVGGLLYGILKSYSPQTCLSLGWAAGALAAASMTDYAMPHDESQLWQIHSGNARVIR